jgi:hypothetical protein
MDNLYLKQEWKRIGISISGGADSALLAYLICSNSSADIHFTSQIRCWKTRPWQSYIADNVINWFKDNFKNNFFVHKNHIAPEFEWGEKGPTIIDEYGKLKSGNQIALRSFNEYVIHKEKLDAWYAGVNKNPDIYIKDALEDRNEGHIPAFMTHMGISICHPFIHTRKDWIIKQYHELGIEELLNLTRSCEGDKNTAPSVFKNLDYTSYVPGQLVPECNECFWCKEKTWAISKLPNVSSN